MNLAQAYSATGVAWQNGPGRVYDVLAEHLVNGLVMTEGDVVLDLGAGTGAATRHLRRRGATVIPLDVSHGMLSADIEASRCAVVGDARHLPFAEGRFDIVVAAFSLNHVPDPVRALCEVRRVLRHGGRCAAAVYAEDDGHGAKGVVDAVAGEFGWRPPDWFAEVRGVSMPALATTERASKALRAAGLDGTADLVEVPIAGLSALQMIDWRLGMAQMAPFVASLDQTARERLRREAEARLGDHPQPLIRRVVRLHAVRRSFEPHQH